MDVELVFEFMMAILGFTRMSAWWMNKGRREIGFVLRALNIRKVVVQRTENNNERAWDINNMMMLFCKFAVAD